MSHPQRLQFYIDGRWQRAATAALLDVVDPATEQAALREAAANAGANLVIPPPKLCTDNGAMIAWAGAERLALGDRDDLSVSARARWPLDGTDMSLVHAA